MYSHFKIGLQSEKKGTLLAKIRDNFFQQLHHLFPFLSELYWLELRTILNSKHPDHIWIQIYNILPSNVILTTGLRQSLTC